MESFDPARRSASGLAGGAVELHLAKGRAVFENCHRDPYLYPVCKFAGAGPKMDFKWSIAALGRSLAGPSSYDIADRLRNGTTPRLALG